MSQLDSDLLTRKHQKELAQMRGGLGSRLLRAFFTTIVIGFAGFSVLALVFDFGPRASDFNAARQTLASRGTDWSADLIDTHREYRDWLSSHGTKSEADLFDWNAELLFKSASSLQKGDAEPSFFGRTYLAIHFAILRISFIFLACWRLWLVCGLVGFVLGGRVWRAHNGRDMLGETGNGRLFYSGIRVALDEVNKRGAPEKLVTGLACPPASSAAEAKTSKAGVYLDKRGILNNTNLSLIAIIERHGEFPAYVADRNEGPLLEQSYAGGTLREEAYQLLTSVLTLHDEYQNEDGVYAPNVDGSPNHEDRHAMQQDEYAGHIKPALHRVLTPAMRMEMAKLPAARIATTILAYQAGKVLAYSKEAGQWIRKSNFSQLCARAVLHAVSAFSDEYGYDEREDVRRALVYGSRSSVFGPVRLPVDLSSSAQTLRQWVEVLMACPHELQAVADEVELFGLVCESHKFFKQKFLDSIMTLNPDVVDGMIASQANLVFVPLQRILRLLYTVIDEATLRRLEELHARVHQKQRLQHIAVDFGEEGADAAPTPMYERIVPPLSFQEAKDLAALHEVPLQGVRDWSALRTILFTFGWLARRVGDNSVPDSSLTLAAFFVGQDSVEANPYGYIGKSAMIPLRATHLIEKWGPKFWQSRFPQSQRAAIAETRSDYQKLLEGVSVDIGLDDVEPSSGIPA